MHTNGEKPNWILGVAPEESESIPRSPNQRSVVLLALLFSVCGHAVLAEMVGSSTFLGQSKTTDEIISVDLVLESAVEPKVSSPAKEDEPPVQKREAPKKALPRENKIIHKEAPRELANKIVAGDLERSEPKASEQSSSDYARASFGERGQSAAKAEFAKLILAHLNEFKEYPRMARKRGIEGAVSVELVIGRNGDLQSSKLLKSSGFEELDQSALVLLQKATPYPTAPAEIVGDSLRFSLPIIFSLH